MSRPRLAAANGQILLTPDDQKVKHFTSWLAVTVAQIVNSRAPRGSRGFYRLHYQNRRVLAKKQSKYRIEIAIFPDPANIHEKPGLSVTFNRKTLRAVIPHHLLKRFLDALD